MLVRVWTWKSVWVAEAGRWGELLTCLTKLADGRVVVDNGCGRPERGREAGRAGLLGLLRRVGTAL